MRKIFNIIITMALVSSLSILPVFSCVRGFVGIGDVISVAEHFGQTPSHSAWEFRFDVNGDSFVGIDDVVSVAELFVDLA